MSFEEIFKTWTLDQKVEWALGPNICNLSENMRSIIVDLKDENERLKAEREEANSWDDSWKMAAYIRQLEKSLVNARKENAKLKCLALHAMIGYGKWGVYTCHYKYKHEIMYKRWSDFTYKVKEAYRKSKKALSEQS